MKHLLEVCLIAVSLATGLAVAQDPTIPMQKGISVQLPTTTNAVDVPSADQEDALVVAVTHDGRIYSGTQLIDPANLANELQREVGRRADKRLYVKADARAPYASVVKVLDAARTSGARELTLLTDQRVPSERGKLVTPTGLEMLLPRAMQAQ